MALNVFEGARRISYLLMGVWAIGVVIFVINDTPSISASYVVRYPDEALVRTADSECESHDKPDWFYLRTANGTSLRVSVCFKAMPFKDGRLLIPHRIDAKGMLWGSDRWSTEVSDYVRKRMANFVIPKADQEWAENQYWPARLRQIGGAAVWLIGGCVAIWLITFVAGWIVRGFAGIPMGQDHKGTPAPPSG